jgi:hypothetical protein
MKKPNRKTRQPAKANGNRISSKQAKLPSIDILIRKICRKDRSVGILAR